MHWLKEEDGSSKRYKARLVIKSFQQREGIDYTEIFSPMVKLNTIQTVLTLVVKEYLFLERLDVKTTFLHGDLEKKIYMMQQQIWSTREGKDIVQIIKELLWP